MSRPCNRNSKHRRQYCICVIDPLLHICKYYIREGYKSLILKEFVNNYPDMDIFIYVLSSSIISNIK